MADSWPVRYVRWLIRTLKRLYLWWLRLPLFAFILTITGLAIALGMCEAYEPRRSLRFRRGEHWLKVIPAIRRSLLCRGLADQLQKLVDQGGIIKLMAAPVRFGIQIISLPVTVALTLACNPATVRAMAILTLVPLLALRAAYVLLAPFGGTGSSKAKQARLPVILPTIVAWLVPVALLVAGRRAAASQNVRLFTEWAVSDIPVDAYIVLLAVALASAACARVLRADPDAQLEEPIGTKALRAYHVQVSAATVSAAVAATMMMRLFNPALFSRERLAMRTWAV